LFNPGFALKRDAERMPNHAAPPIATDEILSSPSLGKSIQMSRDELDAVSALLEGLDAPAETRHDIAACLCMIEQESFDVHLIGTMDRFRHLIDLR
jgi:hypothetical protein